MGTDRFSSSCNGPCNDLQVNNNVVAVGVAGLRDLIDFDNDGSDTLGDIQDVDVLSAAIAAFNAAYSSTYDTEFDLDGDGDLDVLACSESGIRAYLQRVEKGTDPFS